MRMSTVGPGIGLQSMFLFNPFLFIPERIELPISRVFEAAGLWLMTGLICWSVALFTGWLFWWCFCLFLFMFVLFFTHCLNLIVFTVRCSSDIVRKCSWKYRRLLFIKQIIYWGCPNFSVCYQDNWLLLFWSFCWVFTLVFIVNFFYLVHSWNLGSYWSVLVMFSQHQPLYLLVCLIPHSSFFCIGSSIGIGDIEMFVCDLCLSWSAGVDVSPFLSCEILVSYICSVAK